MKLIWSETALSQAREATDYIAESRPSVALDWLHELFERVEALSEFPEQGRNLLGIEREDLREVLHEPYRVIYAIREDTVEILLLRHMKRDRVSEEDVGGRG